MITLIMTIHIVVALFLIVVILLQAGKGAELGAVFGSGSAQALFGPSGAAPLLSKLTTTAAIIFMTTCLILAYVSSKTSTVMPETSEEIPIEQKMPLEEETKNQSALEKATDESTNQIEPASPNVELNESSQVDKNQDD